MHYVRRENENYFRKQFMRWYVCTGNGKHSDDKLASSWPTANVSWRRVARAVNAVGSVVYSPENHVHALVVKLGVRGNFWNLLPGRSLRL